jgi:NADPH:quinone reductase-like Zn-dependent oxidoreductase
MRRRGEALAEFSRMIDSGEVHPSVDRTFPLDKAGEAEAWLAHNHVRGKIVLKAH